jgi:hypothetical protein
VAHVRARKENTRISGGRVPGAQAVEQMYYIGNIASDKVTKMARVSAPESMRIAGKSIFDEKNRLHSDRTREILPRPSSKANR